MSGTSQKCGRCNITFAVSEGATSYVNRYSCAECGVPFWEQKGCGRVQLGIEPLNADRLAVPALKIRERADT